MTTTPSKKSPIQFDSEVENPSFDDVTDISAEELAGKTQLVHIIDVRRPDEFNDELGHIAGAKLITLDTVPDHLGEIPKDEPVVFVCRAGGRSARAAAFAAANGYDQVYNMAGGMLEWNALDLETERP